MCKRMSPFLHSQRHRARTELILRLADGSPWTLSVSAGIERFIGHYARLPGIEAEGPLLSYRSVAPIS